MRQVTGFVVLMGASAFMACAAQTPASSTPTTTSTPAAQAPASTSAAKPAGTPSTSTASSTASTTASTTAADAAPKKPFKKPWGWEVKVVNGQDIYCHKEPVPNSRVQKQETCLTQEQLEARSDSSRDYMEQVQRTGGLVSGQGGGLPSGMGR